MEVLVNDNNVDHALRILKKKMQREGIYKDMKIHRHYEKPSEKKARKRTESLRRSRKQNRRRQIAEGY
ncbi:MAG: 30S ribosomal protein S21 [Alphaproteobacteria bacterium]|nr:30S ribosomal protein S21 [Alphaproteobacteria bacterium]